VSCVRVVHAQWSALYQDKLEKVYADFMAKNPNVKVESQRVGDVQKELNTFLAAGTPPDVAMQWRGAMPGLAVKKGFIALDPYLKRDKFDPTIYYENEYKSSQFLGKTYVLPAAATGAWYLIFYNRAHFRDAGLDENKPPATWAEALRYAGALNKMVDGKIQRLGLEPGFKEAGTFNSPFTAWTATNGGRFASDDGRKLQFDGPQAIGAVDWMLSVLKQIGGRDALQEYLTRNTVVSETFTTTGTRSMYLTNHSFPARLKAVAPDLKYGIGSLPRGSDRGTTGIVRGGWANGIPAGVKAEHESWLLTHYLSATREGGGYFMQEQIRPSPIKAVNESPSYNDLPHWEVIKKALAADTLIPQTPLDIEIDKLTAAAMTEVYDGKTDAKAAIAFAQKEGQRQLDEFWASAAR
jgi:multiple sugar transport system substrate-binding protein